jgi:hypothetical protein
MRYEFEREGTIVASATWEGSGRVAVEAIEPSVRAVVDGCLSTEVVFLGSGFDYPREHETDVLQMRRREWTPWEFERACRTLGGRLNAHINRSTTEEAITR